MQIAAIIACMESFAPGAYQENYDNSGLLAGNPSWDCSTVLVSLDLTESVVYEAVSKKANLIITHHPVIFAGLKKLTGTSDSERAIIAAIKNDIAIYAAHTNLDNVLDGVNGRMADRLGLVDRRVLAPKSNTLEKLFVFVPADHAESLRSALFAAGAGQIGAYSECSFGTEGWGTFKAGAGTHPYVGEPEKRHLEKEIRLEVVFPSHLRQHVTSEMIKNHPYEEVAYDLVPLANGHPQIGSGLLGDLPEQADEKDFISLLQERFKIPVIRHSPFTGRPVKKLALCGGSGSFLISNALAAKADFFISADIRYHQFFEAEGRMVIADIGHFESEQFTIDLLYDVIKEKFPTFAVLKTGLITNPIAYFL